MGWLQRVQEAERLFMSVEQIDVKTEHLFHAGMYTRTIRVGAGVVLTGALMRVPTVLIVSGEAHLLSEDGGWFTQGYRVFAGSVGRKLVLVAHSDVAMTMVFPTTATTVEEAERAFTDEHAELMSRRSTTDVVLVTGE